MGDITNEFTSTPDGAEDMPLEALADVLEPHNSGQISKATSEIVSRWISSVMPPRFNLNSIRDYLKHTWGLGPSRQTSVIVFAMTQSIADAVGRLTSIASAKDMLDGAVAKYGEHCHLVLQKASISPAQHVTTATVDSATLTKITHDQRRLASLQRDTLTKYLEIDDASRSQLTELLTLHDQQLDRLALWTSEFSIDFEGAIRPSFNPRHLRHFNFWWNQARVDLCRLYYNSRLEEAPDLLQQITQRSDQQTLDLTSDLVFNSSSGGSDSFTKFGKKLIAMISDNLSQMPRAIFNFTPSAPRTVVKHNGSTEVVHTPRLVQGSVASYTQVLRDGERIALRTQVKGHWHVNSSLTAKLFETIFKAQRDGLSFSGKVVLITGAGNGSIGAEIVKKLLMGGATIIVTTSRDISAAQAFYRPIYRQYGARGSELFVLPFNQGSMKDCQDLVEYVYNDSGLGRDVDVFIPFAAISEEGSEVDQLGPKSELAHRIMLTNVLRLIGFIIQEKTRRKVHFHPTQVLLPLSPNHGTFGGDGLYSESKLGLESLLNRFSSESWKDKISIYGVTIGWTRGTGLMESNDILAETVESHGALTFSQEEMALNILALLSPEVSIACEDEAVVADFGGGLHRLQGLKAITTEARMKIREEQAFNKAISEEDALQDALVDQTRTISSAAPVSPRRTTLKLDFPTLPSYDSDLEELQHLEGMVDLSTTVVIVGFSELGPWGNSRTRWQMESQRKLAQSGYIEMAWLMGLIKHHDGPHKSGGHHAGWVDAQSGEIVQDHQVADRYNKQILDHAGVRLIEPELLGGYDPQKKEFLQEIVVEDDLPSFECTANTAEEFKKRHGHNLSVQTSEDSDIVRVQLKAGAHIMVPKIVPLAYSTVAGLLPTGWNASRYGIPDDIISHVDVVTLYTLCCVAEAFLSAGVSQPQEIFRHIHLSEVGNFIGSSLGGTDKNKDMFHNVRLDRRVQGDVLQETNLNTPAAWVNMLLLGGSGPIKTPVGACATSLESMDIGFDSILSGKSKFCLIGGVDNFQEDESYAFSTMKATVDAEKQFAEGRAPKEFSRPTAETRAGFLEAQGCGVQLICSAELALEMGLPIYAVVAGSAMAADKISRSVPAPGKGLLTFARESNDARECALLDVKHRRTQMQAAILHAMRGDDSSEASKVTSVSSPSTPASSVSEDPWFPHYPPGDDENDLKQLSSANRHGLTDIFAAPSIESSIKRIRRQWGNDFRAQAPQISPMRASLAVFGLTIDDIGIVSLHGTSTKANDINEPETVNQQMTHLGRRGPPILAICQKSITGHPKAPAAAWMLNGCLQALNSGLVPGNFNCDNIDPGLEKFKHLVFPTESISVANIKAFLLNSFGFGQKGAQMIGVAPKYLFATLDRDTFARYAENCSQRERIANRDFAKAIMSNSIFKAQAEPPYTKADEVNVLLNPWARASTNPETREIFFDSENVLGDLEIAPRQPLFVDRDFKTALNQQHGELSSASIEARQSLEHLVQCMPKGSSIGSIGIDIESRVAFTHDSNPIFLERNYTQSERDFASHSSNAHDVYVSRWCAKEAIFKSLGVKSRGAGAPMKDIEVWNDGNGTPRVKVRMSSFFLTAGF